MSVEGSGRGGGGREGRRVESEGSFGSFGSDFDVCSDDQWDHMLEVHISHTDSRDRGDMVAERAGEAETASRRESERNIPSSCVLLLLDLALVSPFATI